jgi:cytochrome c oxidase subunit 1
MTAVAPQSVVPRPFSPVHRPRGSRFLGYLSTTDPKRLGVMYIVTSFVFFMVGGLLALLMRAELARPGLQDSESSPHVAIGTPSTDPNDDQGT